MIKGMNDLNKAIFAELKEFGISKVTCSTSYSYGTDNEDIEYKLTFTEEDKWFMDFVKTRFNLEIKYPFIMSLLHEVGHHKTFEDIEGTCIEEFCDNEKERITNEMETATLERKIELENQYFNLPDEIVATKWAVDYIKCHPLRVMRMWKKIQKALLKFYTENGVNEDDTD